MAALSKPQALVSNSVTKSVELHLHCSFIRRYCNVMKAFGKEETC